jgi:hypothetical protein
MDFNLRIRRNAGIPAGMRGLDPFAGAAVFSVAPFPVLAEFGGQARVPVGVREIHPNGPGSVKIRFANFGKRSEPALDNPKNISHDVRTGLNAKLAGERKPSLAVVSS